MGYELVLSVAEDELFSENFKIKVSDDGMFYEVVGKVSVCVCGGGGVTWSGLRG